MPLYLRGNRILTQREKDNEDLNDGCTDAAMLLIGLIFLITPGILITSLINNFSDFTTSQLWGISIVASIVVFIGIAILLRGEGVVKGYLITALCCTLFMFVYYLFKPDNCFYNTIVKMFETESTDDNTPQEDAASDSITYNTVSNNYYNEMVIEEKNDQELEEETNTEQETVVEEETSSSTEESPIMDSEKPEFPGGNEALHDFVKKHMYYPPDIKAKGIHGTVYVQFTVLQDGQIVKAEVEKGVDPALDAEAIRLIESMPNWKPQIVNGQPIITVMRYGITFE